MPQNQYTGRFAPSPSGDLHFGSLIAALGSYLHARAQNGQWLVRIDDIDPPREIPGSADRILATLERYGLEWDGDVVWQSKRHDAYREVLDWLYQQQKAITAPVPASALRKAAAFTTVTAEA